MSNLAPVLPATISGSATVPIAKQQETTILILQEQQQQQHPLSPTLTHQKQSPIHTELQTISEHHRNEIISINQLNLTNQKDPSLPSIVSKLATITCTAISSQLSPTKQLAAHHLFNTATIPVDESNNIEKCLLSDTERIHHHNLVDSSTEPSPRHSLSSITHSPPLEASQKETFTTSISPSSVQQQPFSYESYSSTLLCDSQNDAIKDDDDDVFTWKSPRTGTTFNIQLSTTISDNGNELTTTTTATTADELLSQPKLIKTTSVTRTPKISELTSSSLENDDENKCSSPAGGNLSLSLSPPVNRRREMPALRGPYVSL